MSNGGGDEAVDAEAEDVAIIGECHNVIVDDSPLQNQMQKNKECKCVVFALEMEKGRIFFIKCRVTPFNAYTQMYYNTSVLQRIV